MVNNDMSNYTTCMINKMQVYFNTNVNLFFYLLATYVKYNSTFKNIYAHMSQKLLKSNWCFNKNRHLTLYK